MATKAQDQRKTNVERVEALSTHLAFCSQKLAQETRDLKKAIATSENSLVGAIRRLSKARVGIIKYLHPVYDNDKALDFKPDPKGPEREYWLALQVVQRIQFAIDRNREKLLSDHIKALKQEVSDTKAELEKAKEEAIK